MGFIDFVIEVWLVGKQVDDLLGEIRKRVEVDERVLVTTLTKRMSEDLTEYYSELGVRVRYLHSDIDTIERVEILRDLRKGEFDVLVGINLLREGLDLPEVSLVAILDADKQGFLRSARSLIQTIGRAARNANGRVIMYADKITAAMEVAISETERRRVLQTAYNEEHGITPQTIRKAVLELDPSMGTTDWAVVPKVDGADADQPLAERLEALRAAMYQAAEDLDFEKAASFRDEIKRLEGGDRAPRLRPGKRQRPRR